MAFEGDVLEAMGGLSGTVPESAPTGLAGITKSGAGLLGKLTKGGLGRKIGIGLGGYFMLKDIYDLVQQYRTEEKQIEAVRNQPVVSAQEMLQRLRLQELVASRTANLQFKRPDLYENLQWVLSGQKKPAMSSREIMIGARPDFAQIPPQAIEQAVALMTNADQETGTLSRGLA